MSRRYQSYKQRALAVLLSLLLSGSSIVSAQEQITLRVITGYGKTDPIWEDIVRDYEALNPHITIENRGKVADADVLLIQILSGEPPDIIKTDMPTVLSLYKKGLIQPMPDRYVERFTEAYFPIAVKALKVGNTLLGVPASSNVTAMIYNTRLFAEKGISDPPRTWDELDQIGPKLTKYDGSRMVLPALTENGNWSLDYFLAASIYAEGGRVVDEDGNLRVDEAPTYRAFQRWIGALTEKNYMAFRLGTQFLAGQIPMAFAWPYWQRTLVTRGQDLDDYRTVVTPAGSAGSSTAYRNHTYSVPSLAQHKEEAWKFLDWITTAESSLGGTRLGYFDSVQGSLPITRTDVTAPYNVERRQFIAGFLDALNFAVPSMTWIQYGVPMAPLSAALKESAFDGVSPQEAIYKAVTTMSNRMAEWNE